MPPPPWKPETSQTRHFGEVHVFLLGCTSPWVEKCQPSVARWVQEPPPGVQVLFYNTISSDLSLCRLTNYSRECAAGMLLQTGMGGNHWRIVSFFWIKKGLRSPPITTIKHAGKKWIWLSSDPMNYTANITPSSASKGIGSDWHHTAILPWLGLPCGASKFQRLPTVPLPRSCLFDCVLGLEDNEVMNS